MLHPNGDSCGDTLQTIHNVKSIAENELRGRDDVQSSHPKPHPFTASHPGKRHNQYAIQQVISARQHKIYDQQCEIEELRRRIRDVCSDNKFLREQNYWQGKALEKLDGKHAELPQLINGHLEEIRVFREQIKRMKEVLKQEKQRRHDAEGSKDKLLYELKHLRKLAEEQKLLERENLMKTIEKLQTEAQERERLLVNLEKYAVNLEKNQRFESLRSSRAQREMRETCQQLLDKIRELEQTVQEKQKVIELGNIYSKRTRAQSLTAHFGPSTSTPSESSNQVETVAGTLENAVNTKCTLRDRIKVFDQKRQDMERKRERIRRKRQQQSSRVHSVGDELEVDLSQTELFQPPAVLQSNPVRPFSARLPISKVADNSSINTRPKSSYNLIVLPKITSKESLSNNENDSVKVSRSSVENKLVRFCLSTRKSKKPLRCQDDALFEELRRNELLARMVAESQLARARDSFPCSLESLTRACKTSSIEDNLASKAHSQSLDRLSEEHVNDISDQRRISTYVNEDDSPSPFQPECVTPTDFIDSSKVVTTRGSAEMKGLQKGLGDTEQESKHSAQLHPIDAIKVVPPEQIIKNDDCISHNPQLPPGSDLFHLLSVHDPISKTCQPCGDHTDTPLTTDVQTESVSSDGLAMGSEDLLWQETPSVHLTSSLGSSVMYHALSGMSVLDDTKGEGSDVRYMSENEYNYQTDASNVQNSTGLPRNDLSNLKCSARTTTLYTMINNSANNGKFKKNQKEK